MLPPMTTGCPLTRYAAGSSDGRISFSFGGEDKTGMVTVPATGGGDIWDNLIVAENVALTEGVQTMKLLVGGSGGFNINQIGSQLGFQDISYFSRFFKKRTGMTPLQFRKRIEKS